jgi:outer membrane receptor for ferrienterochelin and colicins
MTASFKGDQDMFRGNFSVGCGFAGGLGALLLSVTIAAAQDPRAAALAGVVKDGSGRVVSGATVTVSSSASAFDRVIEAGRDGRFEVRGLSAGDYVLTIVAVGFGAETATVAVPAREAVEIRLQPAPVVEEVRVVSAARQEELRESLNTRVDVISRARMEESGAETVAEVLRDLPGVLTRRGSETAGAAGEQIQGIDSRQVLVLLDGQPITGARGIKRGVVNLDRQSTARLERVEVVKGAASALYGSDAIGGVINLISREASAPLDLGASVTGGDYGDVNARAEAGIRRGGYSALFIAERHQHDGFDLTPSTFDTTGAAFRRTDAFAKFGARLSPAVTLTANVNGYGNHTTGRSNGELGPQSDDIHEDSVNAGATVDWLARPGTSVQGRVYVSRFDERSTGLLAPPRSTPVEPGSLDEDLTKVDASVSHIIGARQHLLAGVEYWSNDYAGLNRIAFDDGVSASTAVGWFQHRLSFGDRATTTVGARVDRHSTFGTAVSPKIAGNLRLVRGVHARASYGRGFRAPDLGQLYYRFLNPSSIYQVIGNPGLLPEYANSLQVGADATLAKRRARLGVNFFRNNVRDLIESVSLGMVVTADQLAALLAREGLDPSFRPVLGRLLFTYKNVNDAVTHGVELDGDMALLPQLSIGGAYTYLQARDADTDLSLTGRHAHQGHMRISWHVERIGLRTSLRATSYSSWIAARATQPTGGVVDTVAPGFTLWDVSASQRIVRGLSAFLSIENLTDNQDPNTGITTATGAPAAIYRPEIGRTARFGVRWSWAAR